MKNKLRHTRLKTHCVQPTTSANQSHRSMRNTTHEYKEKEAYAISRERREPSKQSIEILNCFNTEITLEPKQRMCSNSQCSSLSSTRACVLVVTQNLRMPMLEIMSLYLKDILALPSTASPVVAIVAGAQWISTPVRNLTEWSTPKQLAHDTNTSTHSATCGRPPPLGIKNGWNIQFNLLKFVNIPNFTCILNSASNLPTV